MRTSRISILLSIIVSVCLFTSCNPKTPSAGSGTSSFGETAFVADTSTLSSAGNKPITLKLVVNDTYCTKTACACIHHLASREYDGLIEMLKSDYNIYLQLTYCIEEYDLEDSVKSQKFDGAICKPWFAFRHVAKFKMNYKRIVDVIDPYDKGSLTGIFIVNKDSPIQKPEDINGKILCTGQEDSFEKYHLPMAMLTKEGIKPAKLVEKSGCIEGINMLLDNEAEVAVISDYALAASCAVDVASEDAFRTIWKTSEIPLCSVILDLNRISEAEASRFQNALLQLSGAKMPGSFSSKGFVKPVSWIPEPFIK
jgi:ABC-type phosphate/phosphonate transport system substrate-binding protein